MPNGPRCCGPPAEDAGCETVLALTEIKETWDTEPGRRGRGVDLTYIITSELTLSWWTGVPGGEPVSLYVPDEQVCASTPSADLKPYDSEYTGYMGKYGNTMDRWYRRAAVVVRPRRHAFAARAEASPSWALAELSARIDAGDLAGARAAAGSVAPFWKAPGPELMEPVLTGPRLRSDRGNRAKHYLVTREEDLGVLGAVGAGEQGQPVDTRGIAR